MYIYIYVYIYIYKDVSLVYAHCLAYVCIHMYIYIIWLIHRSNLVDIIDAVDFSEILHQLVDGLSPHNPIIYSVS